MKIPEWGKFLVTNNPKKEKIKNYSFVCSVDTSWIVTRQLGIVENGQPINSHSCPTQYFRIVEMQNDFMFVEMKNNEGTILVARVVEQSSIPIEFEVSADWVKTL